MTASILPEEASISCERRPETRDEDRTHSHFFTAASAAAALHTRLACLKLLVRHKIGKHTQFYLLHTQLYKSDLETDLKAFENYAGLCSTPSPDSILKIFRNAILLRKGYLLATTQIMIRKGGGEPSPSVCCRIVLVEISRIKLREICETAQSNEHNEMRDDISLSQQNEVTFLYS